MAQKVITVTAYPDNKKQIEELDFPQVSQALDEGWVVKDFKQMQLPAGFNGTYFVITFILEKNF